VEDRGGGERGHAGRREQGSPSRFSPPVGSRLSGGILEEGFARLVFPMISVCSCSLQFICSIGYKLLLFLTVVGPVLAGVFALFAHSVSSDGCSSDFRCGPNGIFSSALMWLSEP
jgi:hypothetical protein